MTPITQDQYTDFVGKLFNRTGDLSKDFAHAVLGMTTEAAEMRLAGNAVNEIEEFGDFLFFSTAALIVLRDLAPDEVCPEALWGAAGGDGLWRNNPEEPLGEALQVLQDVAKPWVGYDKVPTVPVAHVCALTVAKALGSLIGLLWYLKTSNRSDSEIIQVAVQANVKKLRHRYPGGFNVDDASNRDLEGERRVLESAAGE